MRSRAARAEIKRLRVAVTNHKHNEDVAIDHLLETSRRNAALSMELEQLRNQLDQIRDRAEEALAVAICDNYQPGDERTTDALISARAVLHMTGEEPPRCSLTPPSLSTTPQPPHTTSSPTGSKLPTDARTRTSKTSSASRSPDAS